MMGSMKHLSLLLAAAVCLSAPLPLAAQDELDDIVAENETAPAKPKAKSAKNGAQTPAQKKAAAKLRKAELAKKQFEKGEKARAKVKIKWESSDKKAFREAAKYNLPVWVLYTDPATCPYCVKLDNEILFSKEFKKATGAFVGYRSASPLPQYGLASGKPMGTLYTPDKKPLGTLAYTPNQSPSQYLDIIRRQGDAILKAAKEKIESDIQAAQAEVEAATEPAEEE